MLKALTTKKKILDNKTNSMKIKRKLIFQQATM